MPFERYGTRKLGATTARTPPRRRPSSVLLCSPRGDEHARVRGSRLARADGTSRHATLAPARLGARCGPGLQRGDRRHEAGASDPHGACPLGHGGMAAAQRRGAAEYLRGGARPAGRAARLRVRRGRTGCGGRAH
eukprot:scaffold4229_cov67-Phaeocystis_antarctica.AAC.4